MKILGVDYGRAKIGLAFTDGWLAQPWKVVKVKNWEDALEKVAKVSNESEVLKVVIGISEGAMGEEQKKFARELAKRQEILVETQDEDLTTKDAQKMAIEAGIPREKRKKMEDAFAASLMLQSWLDKKKIKDNNILS